MNLSALICKLPHWLGGGHRRGVRVTDTVAIAQACALGKMIFRCPRCGATHTRKVKAKKEKAA